MLVMVDVVTLDDLLADPESLFEVLMDAYGDGGEVL
nr:MAG: hypothetical protein [Bacteriophage sp.]